MDKKRIFISADHGLAVIYFLQSDLVPTLLGAGHEVVVLTDDALVEGIQQRFSQPGLIVEGLRLKKANQYAAQTDPEMQWWLNFLRRVGSSNRINTAAMDSYIYQVAVEENWKRRALMPAARTLIGLLRHSKNTRRALVDIQKSIGRTGYRNSRVNPQASGDTACKFSFTGAKFSMEGNKITGQKKLPQTESKLLCCFRRLGDNPHLLTCHRPYKIDSGDNSNKFFAFDNRQ